MLLNDYDKFKKQCLESLQSIQEEFKKLNGLDDYDEWYYDHGLGIFTFKSDKGNLYFRYVDIGTYSRNTKTWKWSWDNAHTPDRVKEGMEKVKSFGEENGFSRLTTGLIDADEYTGWEMTAIAAKLLSGMGAYKAPVDHLDAYFVFVGELSQEQFEDLTENYVQCDEHGSRKPAFVCQHLNKSKVTGFHEAFPSDPDDDSEEDDLQGWCDACEIVRLKEGEWNENSMAFANIRLVCDRCYFEIKERNLGYRKG